MTMYPEIEMPDTLYALSAEDYPDAAPEAHDAHLLGVLAQIADERWRQVCLGYHGNHDDSHTVGDLLDLGRMRLVLAGQETDDEGTRTRLIQAAAVIVAAVQSWDRRAVLLSILADTPAPAGGEG